MKTFGKLSLPDLLATQQYELTLQLLAGKITVLREMHFRWCESSGFYLLLRNKLRLAFL